MQEPPIRRKYMHHPDNLLFRALAAELGYSLIDIARLWGKSERTIYGWSTGLAKPAKESIFALEVFLAFPEVKAWAEERRKPVSSRRTR